MGIYCSLLPNQRSISFIDKWHSITVQRFQLQQKFQSSLAQKEFIGVKLFTMHTEVAFLQCIMDTVENSSSFLSRYDSYGSRVYIRQGHGNVPASIAPMADIWELQFPNIELLKPVLGEDYWWAATGEQFGFGDNSKKLHNFIKPIDSEIILKFDAISKKLVVSYRCVHGDQRGAIDAVINSLTNEQDRLVGKVYSNGKDKYRIISVEMNATDFVKPRTNSQKKDRYTTTMVAWLIDEGIQIKFMRSSV